MRGFLTAISGALLAVPMLAGPGRAEEPLAEVSGNWAGASGQGFAFRALLTDDGGQARLRIFQGTDAASLGASPELDVTPVVYRDTIVAGDHQGLELVTGPDSTTLQIVTDSDDEQYGFREVVEVQFLDFQFTVVGYAVDLTDFSNPGESYSCHVDLRDNRRVVNGRAEPLPPRPFEADNLSDWGPDAALAKGLCPAPG